MTQFHNLLSYHSQTTRCKYWRGSSSQLPGYWARSTGTHPHFRLGCGGSTRARESADKGQAETILCIVGAMSGVGNKDTAGWTSFRRPIWWEYNHVVWILPKYNWFGLMLNVYIAWVGLFTLDGLELNCTKITSFWKLMQNCRYVYIHV